MKANDKRQLGRIDLDLTILGFGTVAMGNLFKSISEADANATIGAAWDAGIRYFDTAPLYGHGIAELRTGTALRLKPRSRWRPRPTKSPPALPRRPVCR